MPQLRTCSELFKLESFEDRFRYLMLNGIVGDATFGFDRYMNQMFYSSTQWRRVRQHVIARDDGSDLGFPGYEIFSRPIIHHINPMVADDIRHGAPEILDPEFLITTTHQTHNAIHYGDERQLKTPFVERRPGDTTPWR